MYKIIQKTPVLSTKFSSGVNIGKTMYTLLSAEGAFQNPKWMPQTLDSIEPYICDAISYTYIPMINFN